MLSNLSKWIEKFPKSVLSFSGLVSFLLAEPLINSLLTWPITGVPLPPTIQKEKTKTLSCDVNLAWSTPADNGSPLTKYSVYYSLSYEDKQEAIWHEINDLKENALILTLKCNSRYVIEVSAWNECGGSNRSKTLEITTNSG